ncbi:MAG: hypothetical protein Q8Q09_07545 [Deltaproteobacteria bacterium]|nr:hypothetical protein [Deltaproteobacteria bacterium]
MTPRRVHLSLCLLCSLAHCSPANSPASDASTQDTSPSLDVISEPSDDVAMPPSDASEALPNVTVAQGPTARAVEPGVIREVFTIAVPAPPPNRAVGRTETPTPASLNRVQILRYRAANLPTDPRVAVRGVVVAVPGFLGGAGSFDGLARALVKRAVTDANPVEVWALDRRSNLLEDLRGMDAADAMGDPELARRYYVNRAITVNGQRFEGYLSPTSPSLAYMSEWGLPSLIEDLRAVIATIPSSRERVVLLGHSLGASIVEAYASWEFADRTRGYDSIAALSLVDGVASGASVTETEYLEGGAMGGFGPSQGVTALRSNGPYFVALPLLGVQAVAVAEITARRALSAPDAVVPDNRRDELLRTLLSLDSVPPMTNAAAFGFAFDTDSCALSFAAMSVGSPVGPTRRVASILGPMITVPASGTERYLWTDATASTPREFTPVANAAHGWAASPTNFAEWYFPSRLSLDVSALGDLRLQPSSWAWREGLRAQHSAAIDVPVLAVGTALVSDPARFAQARARLSAPLGATRPNAGTPRSDDRAFRVVMIPSMSHIDPIMAPDTRDPENPVPAAVLSLLTQSVSGGTVALPAR